MARWRPPRSTTGMLVAVATFLLAMTGSSSWQQQPSGNAVLKNKFSSTLPSRRHFFSNAAAVVTTTTSTITLLSPTIGRAESTAPSSTQPQQYATSAGRRGCTTLSDPSKTTVTCQGDLLYAKVAAAKQNDNKNVVVEVRLSGIAATENGVSTSAVRNPSRFSPPWTYLTETASADTAWTSLLAALQQVEPTAMIDVVDTNYQNSGLYYVHALVNGGGGGDNVDDVEFLLRPDDEVVLFRSACRTSVFVYPLTQPVSDGNRNLKRMQKIRNVLGWGELGYPQQGSKPL